MLEHSQKLKLSGKFILNVSKDGEVVRTYGPFHNMITDLGLNYLGTAGTPNSRAYVGTGTVPATASDTNMGVFKVASNARTGRSYVAATSPNFIAQELCTYRFNAGTINGNITEVGIGWGSNPLNALWSRELIVDSLGNPVTVTVLETEILDVVYVRELAVPQDDTTGSFVINGVTYDYVMRSALAGSWKIGDEFAYPTKGIISSRQLGAGVTLGPITANTSGGASTSASSASSLAYVQGSYERAGVTSWALGAGNITGGIHALELRTDAQSELQCYFKMSVTPPIPKTALNTFSMTMKFSWGRG